MSVIIPFFNDQASFQEEVTLDGIPYLFKFTYNNRYDFWSMDILTKDEEPIVQGLKIVLNYELISRFRYLGVPAGELYAIDSTEKETRVNRENLGNTVQLFYVESSELETFFQ